MGVRLLAVLTPFVAFSCGVGDEPQRLHTSLPPPQASGTVAVEPRQPLLPTFPCSRCHAARLPDTRERTLTEFHTQRIVHHGTLEGWCYRCHTKDNINRLHLADGTLVTFDRAFELCGSCHGDKFRDWKDGIHGLTTGYWLGDRVRRSCTACHDPHKPAFPPMTPERPPALPRTVTPRQIPEERHGGE